MLKHAKFLATMLILSLMVGLAPTGSVLAAESEVTDDVIMLDAATENAGDTTAESEEHYWVRYAWNETSHWLICSCGVEDCPQAGGNSRSSHDFGEWWILKEATTDEEGLRSHYCWCGYSEEEAIPKIVTETPEEGSEETEQPEGSGSQQPGETTKPDEGTSDGTSGSESSGNGGSSTTPEETSKPEQKPEETTKPDEGTTGGVSGGASGNETSGGTSGSGTSSGTSGNGTAGTATGSESNNNGGNSMTIPTSPATGEPTQPPIHVPVLHPVIVNPVRPVIIPVEPVKPVEKTPQILKPLKVYQITITNAPKTLKVGKKVRLKVRCDMANIKNKKITWKSSNCKYATVNKNGVVKAKKAGKGKTVKITAIAKGYTSKNTLIRVKVVVKIKIK